jgi:hypothetical protein
MQVLLNNKIFANLRDAKNRGKFLSGLMLALWSHPTAEELSLKLRKHSSALVLSCKIACQMEMTDAKNSRQLFL